MSNLEISDPVSVCEALLRGELEYNEENQICPSVNVVISRFLERRDELVDAYAKIHGDLSPYPGALRRFLDAVVGQPAVWGLGEIANSLEARKRLTAVNSEIVGLARTLAGLLRERTALGNDFSLDDKTYYDIVDMTVAAGEGHVLFNGWVRERLSELGREFGLKYWPNIDELIDELGRNAELAEIKCIDPIMTAAMATNRPEKAAFIRGLLQAIKENSTERHGPIPVDYRPNDETMATLLNCALDLRDDEIVDAIYIKRFRQEERKAGRL